MTQAELQKLQKGDRVSINFHPYYNKLVFGIVTQVDWCTHWGENVVYNVLVLIDGDPRHCAPGLDKIQLI